MIQQVSFRKVTLRYSKESRSHAAQWAFFARKELALADREKTIYCIFRQNKRSSQNKKRY